MLIGGEWTENLVNSLQKPVATSAPYFIADSPGGEHECGGGRTTQRRIGHSRLVRGAEPVNL